MNDSDDYPPTIKIRRPPRVTIDARGNAVWLGPVDESELELMTSQELRIALAAASAEDKESITALAGGDAEGVIVRDRATGVFDILSEEQLQEMMDLDRRTAFSGDEKVPADNAEGTEQVEEISLVTTQALRLILDSDDNSKEQVNTDEHEGFDPYNRE